MALPATVNAKDSFEIQRTALNATITELGLWKTMFEATFVDFPTKPWYMTLFNPDAPVVDGGTTAVIQMGADSSDNGYTLTVAYDMFGGGTGQVCYEKVFNDNLTPDERLVKTQYSDGSKVFFYKTIFTNPSPTDTEVPVVIRHAGSPSGLNTPALLFSEVDFNPATRTNMAGWGINYTADNLWFSRWDGTDYTKILELDGSFNVIRFFDGSYALSTGYAEFDGNENDLSKGYQFQLIAANRYSQSGTSRVETVTQDEFRMPIGHSQAGGRVYITMAIKRYNSVGGVYSTNAEIYDLELFVNPNAGTIVPISCIRNNVWVDRTTAFGGSSRLEILAPGSTAFDVTLDKIGFWTDSGSDMLIMASAISIAGGITPWQTGTPESGGTDIHIFVTYRTEAAATV